LEIVRVEFRTNVKSWGSPKWTKHESWGSRDEAEKLIDTLKLISGGTEYRIVPLGDDEKMGLAMKMREQLFELAGSFVGERTSQVAVTMYGACEKLRNAKECLMYCQE
jgi:hypothetical protein